MIRDQEELESRLSDPTQPLVEALPRIEGDILILGAGGKMGPTLARMACRATEAAGFERRIIATSRFSEAGLQDRLDSWGVSTLPGDLLDSGFVASLPVVPNVIYLVGVKFGTGGAQAKTWASNAYLPGVVCEHFRTSRIVALSTGNVYGMTAVAGSGSSESDPLAPEGEYAMSALGRERVFEHFSRTLGIPLALIRLNYATELRYGVLVDLATKVYRGEPVSLEMGYFNTIWQADANELILRSLEHTKTPPAIFNVTGPRQLGVRELAQRLGELLGKEVQFTGSESAAAFLSDSRRTTERFGPPGTSLDSMLEMTADWISRGQPTWNKPTHFEVRDGKY
jgi:nucleoside-diphosphate-sugar epimerase